jgi:hypothetical protein
MFRPTTDLPSRMGEKERLALPLLLNRSGPRPRGRRSNWKRFLLPALLLSATIATCWVLLSLLSRARGRGVLQAPEEAAVLYALWTGDRDSLPAGPRQDYFRCVRSLARLIYVCRLIDHPQQLSERAPPPTLEACQVEETLVFEQCSRARQAPTRTVSSLTANTLRSLPFFIAATTSESTLAIAQQHSREQTWAWPAITLVTHISLSKLAELYRLAQVWKLPISCSLFLQNLSQIHQVLDAFPSGRSDRIDIHLLIGEQYNRTAYYPFNAARNLALDNARTDWVFLVDVDFVPNPDLARNIKHTLERYPKLRDAMERRKAVLVVPAFEKFKTPSAARETLPATRAALLEEVRSQRIAPFHLSWYWPGHGPTDFMRWFGVSNTDSIDESDKPYLVRYQDGYEPYIVAYRHGLPRYEDRFVGYGWNKQSFIKELHYAGYSMYVLRDGFIIHLNHDYPAGRNQQKWENLQQYNSTKAYHEQLLQKRYGKSQPFAVESDILG